MLYDELIGQYKQSTVSPCFLIYIEDLHSCTIYILDVDACMIYVHELKIITVEVQVWVLSCFPVVEDPSTVEEWRVPFPLAKRVAELVSPLVVHAPKWLEFS